ncbi:hypothetical protein BDZ94DRAFT_1327036 [Collybia nuda]|uniref:DUF6534 domain-containing protein n=1 Tax=Collybia nuda TaxID=64659 RepID=A0A9P5XT41_9AGAR|nr:hypothetical protein BDZ94DRAFT_1327036 [Collybia nuda]
MLSNVDAALPVFNVDLDKSFGPVLVGTFLACWFYGMSVLQTILYFILFPQDQPYVRGLVLLNLVICGALIFALASGSYATLIRHFGNVAHLAILSWGSKASSFLTSIQILMVQSFFTFRIFRMSQSWIACAVAAPFVLATAAVGLSSFGRLEISSSPGSVASLKNINLATDVMMIFTDLLLAGMLSYYLRREKSNGLAATNAVITNLMRYAIGTGAFTAALALIGLIFRQVRPDTAANGCLYLLLPHTYSNAMLITINARVMLRQVWTKPSFVEMPEFRAAQGQYSGGTINNSGVTGHGSGTLGGSRDNGGIKIALSEHSLTGHNVTIIGSPSGDIESKHL